MNTHVKSSLQSFILEISYWTILQSGRLVEIDDNDIKTLIENNQCYTTSKIANILNISKSSFENHLYQFAYVYHFDLWVPYKLCKNKTFLIIFLHVILYLNIMKSFHF